MTDKEVKLLLARKAARRNEEATRPKDFPRGDGSGGWRLDFKELTKVVKEAWQEDEEPFDEEQLESAIITLTEMGYMRLEPEKQKHCGHPISAIESSDEGTSYCRQCEEEARAKELNSNSKE